MDRAIKKFSFRVYLYCTWGRGKREGGCDLNEAGFLGDRV